MNYELPFPSFNNDGVFCVSSSGHCRYSGHSGTIPIDCYGQNAGAGEDPFNSCVPRSPLFILGSFTGYIFPILMILLGYVYITRRNSY